MPYDGAPSLVGPARAAVEWWEARWLRRSVIMVTGGLLLSRTLPPMGWWPLLILVMPLCVLAIDRSADWRSAFGRGWWFGFGFFIASLNWIAISFTQQDNVPVILAPFAIMGLAAAMAVYMGLTFALARRLWPPGPWRVLVFAASWTLFEGLRGVLFTGFPWNLMGVVWADMLWPAQGAWLVSVYGLSLITVWLSASCVLLLQMRWSLAALSPAISAFMLFTGMTAWGGARLQQNPTTFDININLRLVQANVKQRDKWQRHLIEDHFDNHMDLSRGRDTVGKARGVDLLIWPEATVQSYRFDQPDSLHRWRLSRLLEPDSFALIGAPRVAWGDSGRDDDYEVFNSFFTIDARGAVKARYDKQHLVPFGEYLPFHNFLGTLGIGQLTGGRGFASGVSRAALMVDGIPPFRVLICYESIFPGRAADPERRARWLLNITNDGWFGLSEGPYQHFALARMRTIEEGLPMVRSAGGGISAIIDPVGRITAQLGLDRRGAVNGPLPLPVDNYAAHTSTFVRISITFTFCTVVLCIALIMRKTKN